MYGRLALTLEGSPSGNLWPSLPTYSVVSTDKDGQVAICDIPNDTLPPGFPLAPGVVYESIDGLDVAVSITAELSVALDAFLCAYYDKLPGYYQPAFQ